MNTVNTNTDTETQYLTKSQQKELDAILNFETGEPLYDESASPEECIAKLKELIYSKHVVIHQKEVELLKLRREVCMLELKQLEFFGSIQRAEIRACDELIESFAKHK